MMLLAIDLGNSNLYGGVFDGEALKFSFRHKTKDAGSSDKLGLFLKSMFLEHGVQLEQVETIMICSVVPAFDHSLSSACIKYFNQEPIFLTASSPSLPFENDYETPKALGADRVANLVAVSHLYSRQNSLIVDMGTATTICALNKEAVFFGGVIVPGLALVRDALQAKAAQLPDVDIVKVDQALSQSTVPSIQSGLYFGHLGALKEILTRLKQEAFNNEPVQVIATGGFSRLFATESLFDEIMPDLTLQGLRLARCHIK